MSNAAIHFFYLEAHKAACTSCPVSLIWSKCGKEPLCADNVIKTKLNRLTSGYFVYPGDGKDKVKPAGKCSHGAYADRYEMPDKIETNTAIVSIV